MGILFNKLTFAFLATLLFFCVNAQRESMLPDVKADLLLKLIDTAKANYPKMKVFENKLKVADIMIKKERLGYFDIFTFSFLYSPNNTTTLVNPSFLNGYQVGLYINVGRLLQVPKSIKQAKEQYAIAKYDKQEYMLNLEAEVKTRYYTYLQQLATLRMYATTLTDAESSAKQIRYRFEKGEAKFEEYNGSLILYGQQAQLKIQTEGTMLIAKAKLEELIGKKIEDVK